MITGQFWQLHDDDTLRRIDAAAVRLLVQAGCRIEHEGLLHLLEAAGCRIDWGAMRCYLTEELIREAIEHLGGRCSENVEIPVGGNPQYRLGQGGSYPHLLEWPSGRRRLATRQDVIDMARMAHVLAEFDRVGRVLTCHEVDQRVEPIWTTLQLAQTTDKAISGGELFHAACVEPLVRMGEVLTGKPGDTSLLAACDFFIAPLILDREQAECFIAKRRFAMQNVPGTMPISGISAPVTIAGSVTVAIAELVAGWVLGYVVDPELSAGGIVASGSLDMRTMTACFNSPEAVLQDATTVQICRRIYGIPVRASTEYVDCKRPGLEAAFQKMFPLVGAALGTTLSVCGGGLLSAGQDYSPVQHLLDAELNSAVRRFWGTFEVNEETLALGLIEQIMQSGQTNFLNTEHTLAYFKTEQWYPRWLDRTRWQGEAVETDAERHMLERIDLYCRDAIASYERPNLDEAKIQELQCIFSAAERQMLGQNVTST